MFNNDTIHYCLDTLVTLSDANKWSTQYLTLPILSKAFPENTDLTERIAQVAKGSIDKLMHELYVKKLSTENVKSILGDFQLFDGRADFEKKNSNMGRFVGFRFIAKANSDVSVIIDRVSFQIDMACPNLKLYLYSADQPEAIKVIYTPYTQSRGVQWFSLPEPLILNGNSEYYLGYYETDLKPGAQSIRKTLDYVNGAGCTSCNQNTTTNQYYQTRIKYVDIQPLYVDAVSGVELPDMDMAIEVDQNNFGMNLHASVQCDISEFICRNKALIKEPLSLQLAIDLLICIQSSERNNTELEKAKQFISYQMAGDKEQYDKGLFMKLEKMIEALNFDFSGINTVCLPCVRKPGMSYRGLR